MAETAETLECDVLIVGGGIAGLSLASELAAETSVVLLEAEATLAFHTSGRSAQQLIPSYGPPVVRALTNRTIDALTALSSRAVPLVWPSRFMLVGDAADVRTHRTDTMREIGPAHAVGLAPVLRAGSFEAAGLDETSLRTDAAALIEHHRSLAVARGARILTGERVRTAQRDDSDWLVSSSGGTVRARRVVNAAGAWADRVAEMFGARPIGLVALRRTAAYVDVPCPLDPATPMVASADHTWYFRPHGDRVLVSAAEAVPAEAGDAQPVAADVAALVDRLNSITALGITGVACAWTGLRTESADGVPVLGFDPRVEGFLWLAGQGGYGFQTSTGMAELAAAQLVGREAPFPDWVVAGLAPRRFVSPPV